MNKKLVTIVAALYDQFGDQGIAWAQEQFIAYVNPEPAEDSEGDGLPTSDAADPDGLGSEHQEPEDLDGQTEPSLETPAAPQPIVSPEHVADTVLGLVMMAGEVRKFEEDQVTQRVDIAARRDVALAQMRAHQQLLEDYLDRSFDERAGNFKQLFEVVDEALRTDNIQALALGLESVVKLAVSSPFKDLGSVEETATALADPTHEWDF